jgi:agmatinase
MPQHSWENVPDASYVGIQTFMKVDQASPSSPETSDIGIIGVPFDGGVSRLPGARFGPAGIRETSGVYAYYTGTKGEGLTNIDTNRPVDYTELDIKDYSDVPIVPNDITQTQAQIEQYVEAVTATTFPVILGGDHYVTFPSFVGVARAHDEPMGLLHLDAHSDTSSSSSLFGEHYHGSPMARINDSPYGAYKNHAMIGIRGHEGKDYHEAIDDGLAVHTMEDVRNNGIDDCINAAIDHVTKDVESVYLTVDILLFHFTNSFFPTGISIKFYGK